MGTKKRTNQSRFASIPSANIQRSAFNRSCSTKTTFDSGGLYPIFADEVLPGDTINMSATIFARIATLIQPIFDNVSIDLHWWFVPNRLLWDDWEHMNGAQDDPDDSTDFMTPIMESGTGHPVGSVADYLGIPPNINVMQICSFHHRAYALIWNEHYRDQNLQDRTTFSRGSGPDEKNDYNTILKRGKRHDYFTSCLPFPQKGPSVTLPLGGIAPVLLDPGQDKGAQASGGGPPTFLVGGVGPQELGAGGGINAEWQGGGGAGSAQWAATNLTTNLDGVTGTADLSLATAATINSIREAFQIQRLYERDARGGTRYTEVIKSHFGVTSPDSRLQRPEYLGGGTTPVMLTPVPRTGVESGEVDDNIGDLGAYGTATGRSGGFTKSFTEHGVILGLISSRADLNYQQGLNRMFSRRTRFDFFWPALAHLGEQAVLNREIFYSGGAGGSADTDVFGYQERFAEYRYKPSIITSKMRSSDPQSLDVWHLAQDFAALPVLDSEFIEEDPPMARVIAVPSEPHFILDAYFSFKHVRPMPTYSVPGMIDHF